MPLLSFVVLLLPVTINAIYDPSDETNPKPSSPDLKTIKWQEPTLQFHHNYSKVNYQRSLPLDPHHNLLPLSSNPQHHHQPNNHLTLLQHTVTDHLSPDSSSHTFDSSSSSTSNSSHHHRLVRKRRIGVYSTCPDNSTGQYVYRLSCSQFLNCWRGRGFVQNCPPGTLFNPRTLECDHPVKVRCVSGSRRGVFRYDRALLGRSEERCVEGFTGLMPHYTDCGRFVSCVYGSKSVLECPPGTLFDVNSNRCLHAAEAECVGGVAYGGDGSGGDEKGGYERREDTVADGGGYDSQNGGYGGHNARNGSQNGGYGSHSVRNGSQHGVYYGRNGGYGSVSGGHVSHSGQNGGYDSQNGGHGGHDARNISQSGRYGSISGRYVGHNGGYGSHNAGNTQNGGENFNYGSQSGGYTSDGGDYGYVSQNGGYSNQDSGYGSQNGGGSRSDRRNERNYGSNSDNNQNGGYTSQNGGYYTTGYGRQNGGNSYYGGRNEDDYSSHSESGWNKSYASQNGGYVSQNGGDSRTGWRNERREDVNYGSTSHNRRVTSQNGGYNSQNGGHPSHYSQNGGRNEGNENGRYGRYDQNNSWNNGYTIQNGRGSNRSQVENQNGGRNYVGSLNNGGNKMTQGNYGSHYGQNGGSDLRQSSVGTNQNGGRNRETNYNRRRTSDYSFQNGGTPPETTERRDGVPKCPEGVTGLHEHPYDCGKFLNCANGMTFVQDCAPGTLFNTRALTCDFPYNVDCSKNRGKAETSEGSHGDRRRVDQGRTQEFSSSSTSVPPERFRDFDDYEEVIETSESRGATNGGRGGRRDDRSGGEKSNAVDYVYEYDGDIILDVVLPTAGNLERKDACRTDQYACTEQQCVPLGFVCDYHEDCTNSADEANCTSQPFKPTKDSYLAVQPIKFIENVSLSSCSKFCLESDNFTCKAFNYRTFDSNCYLLAENIGTSGRLIQLNLYDYYEHESYSIDCSNRYKCPNGKCVNYWKICDGNDDCGDRTDEKHCSAAAIGYALTLVGGGDNAHEGTIQVTAFGKTGYVCDDLFDLSDANVVCKELGYSEGALEYKSNSFFGNNFGNDEVKILMSDLMCNGSESSLRDCDFSGWGVHTCTEQELAGVVCKTEDSKCGNDNWKCQTSNECIPLPLLCDNYADCADETDESDEICESPIALRLSNGTDDNEGRIEIRYFGTWGTVCDDDFNEDAGKVVCKSLGYKGSAIVKKDGYFGAGEGPIWLDQVNCEGNESSVSECAHWDWGDHNCDHSEDVGVVCSDYDTSGTQRHVNTDSEEAVVKDVEILPTTCGNRKDNLFLVDDDVHFRVVKGSVARKGDYPWQASLRVKKKLRKSHWCGAVIISSRYVLTAAHCLSGFAKGAYVVVAGDYDSNVDEGTEQEATIDEYYVHEDFRRNHKMDNDIALVKLKGRGFRLTQDVQPICLVGKDAQYEGRGLNCTISGFGSVDSGASAYSSTLRAGWLPIVPEEICRMPHVYGPSITDGMICAGYLENGVDACDGDSGGPLACLDAGAFTLYGLTSWGHRCGYANKPGVYVKVAHYRDWIDEKMRTADPS